MSTQQFQRATADTVSTCSKNLPFVLFQIREGLYAVPSENVREITILSNVVGVPNLPAEIRGVINLRGKVIELIDLRIKLGLPPAKAEFDQLIQMLHDREQDHHKWLTELEACVRERRPFKMARDPHACRFGLWYDKYRTDNNLLRGILRRMDKPHQIIHATADEVLHLAEQRDEERALQLLCSRRNQELAGLTRLFDEARRALREQHRELAIVLSRGEKRFAIGIDQVEAVERIPDECIEPMPPAMAGQVGTKQWRIAKRIKSNQTVLLLDEEFLFSSLPMN